MSPSSTTIFHFLLRKAFETFQVYYTILIIAFEFVFNLKHILSSSVTIFQMACLQVSSQQIFSVNKLNVILLSFFCIQLFPTFFRAQVFQGPGFSRSASKVWVQVLEVPKLQCIDFFTLKKKKLENKSKVHKVHKIYHCTIIKQMLK